MKNLVFVIESLDIGGAEKSLTSLLQAMDHSRYKVDLLIFKPNGYFTEFVPSQVSIIQMDYPQLSLLDRAIFFIQRKTKRNFHSAQLFWSILKNKFKLGENNRKYDVAISYSQGFATYYTERYLVADKKYAWLNTDYLKAGYNIAYDYPIYKNFDSIVAVSPEAKIALERQLKHIHKQLPIKVIKDMVNPKVIAQQAQIELPQPFHADVINIVSVGRLETVKGFKLAVEACKLLIDKKHVIQWYIVGEGQERKNLEFHIDKYNLKDVFILVGADPNPYRYMNSADIYVQTSLYEGLGLTVIEAASLCKSIVCTNFPSAKGILENEKTGLIVPMTAKSIAAGIERLINDRGLRTTLVQNLSFKVDKSMEQTLLEIDALFYSEISN